MSDADKRVQCERHGETAAAYACVHLVGGVGCGFHGSPEEPDDPWPDAWCDLCNAVVARDREWNEANEPEIRLLCTGCYETGTVNGQVVSAAPQSQIEPAVSGDQISWVDSSRGGFGFGFPALAGVDGDATALATSPDTVQVVFAGDAQILCPLTVDDGALRLFLELAGTDLLPVPGSDLGLGIDRALAAFPGQERKFKVAVLLSDGEDLEGRGLKAARRAAGEGVVVHAVGFGGTAGEPIPVFDEKGVARGFKKDAKGGVVSLTRSLAVDWGAKNIRVNCICPGPIATPMIQSLLDDPATGPGMYADVPMARVGQPEEVAKVAVFLASDDASYVNGAIVPVDGGMSVR